tara:strand:- start:12023 stop:12397 length:375 start_codon:yes stop_codon:yes gene_type:complete
MESTDYKKIYIFENINMIENHNKIVNFINFYKIKHTENSNGYFLNISVLDDKFIDILYRLIHYSNNNIDELEKQKNLIEEINYSDNLNVYFKKVSKIEYNDIKLNEFTGIDKEYISLSKNYKFE